MITLLTHHYVCRTPERQAELEQCLEQNLANDAIDRIIVFAQDSHPLADGPRLTLISTPRRPTYRTLFDYARVHLHGTLCLIAHADVCFDESLQYFQEVEFSHTCLMMRCRGGDAGATPESSRAFRALAFRAPLDEANTDILMGSRGGEGRLAHELQRARLTTREVGSFVRACHVHRIAEHSQQPVCEGPYADVPTPLPDTPKVWGIGLQRTGTTSLSRALNVLEIPTLERYGSWFLVKLENGRLNFDPSINHTYFQGYADSPVPMFFREVDEMFHGSRFVLTTRDPRRWVRSVQRLFTAKPYWDETPEGAVYNAFHELSYGVSEFEPSAFLAGYERHRQAVLNHFRYRPDHLLVLDLDERHKWQRLCEFLGRPAPDVPFPHLNRKAFRPLWALRRTLTGRVPRPAALRQPG